MGSRLGWRICSVLCFRSFDFVHFIKLRFELLLCISFDQNLIFYHPQISLRSGKIAWREEKAFFSKKKKTKENVKKVKKNEFSKFGWILFWLNFRFSELFQMISKTIESWIFSGNLFGHNWWQHGTKKKTYVKVSFFIRKHQLLKTKFPRQRIAIGDRFFQQNETVT